MRRAGRVLLACVTVSTLLTVGSVSAQSSERGLERGPWWASGDASGVATDSQEGGSVRWEGEIPAQFEFAISKEESDAPGVAEGTWEHQGGAQLIFSVPGQGEGVADVLFVGGGAISGSDTQLLLTGTSSTFGSVQFPGGSFPIGSTSSVPAVAINIGAVTCDEAYGDWVVTIEEYFEGNGFSATFSGFWIGFRDVEGIQREIADALAAFDTGPGEPPSEFETRSELVGMSSAMRREYNRFVDDYPSGWTTERVLDMAARTEALTNVWRNLSECDAALFGEGNVEIFINGLTLVIQGLIAGGAQIADSEVFVQLASLGARTGAFGAGAANPAAAARAEQALIDAGSEMLNANVDPEDGRIRVNDDTTRVMATGAAMNWEYDVNGESLNARETYESAMGESAPPIEGAEGEP